ncbi:MAG: SWIM zinc finger family protein [Pseudomonadota bacterium]
MARYWDFYERSAPRQANGGIKAQTKRGAFANNWWGRKWEEVIESFHIGERLGRGRAYARKGQVLSIVMEKGGIEAQVQGSRARPYRVTIKVKPIPPSGWARLAKTLSQKAVFAARLLAGEMPEELEQVVQDEGYSLFPRKSSELGTQCSCPDWSNPCKHIAAVYYLISEELDRDPFLLLRLRGIEREDLLKAMNVSSKAPAAESLEEEEEVFPPEPLPTDPVLFWQAGPAGNVKPLDAAPPAVPAALARRLGPFPFWRGEDDFLSHLEGLYAKASPGGLEASLPPSDE